MTAPQADPRSDLEPTELERRARRIRWLLLDVDGLLTDGRLYYGAGREPAKAFHVRDGLAIKLAQSAGVKVGLLSGRADDATGARAADLGIDEAMLGFGDKEPAFRDFLERRSLAAEEVAYGGDDLPDLPVLTACGLSFAPADAEQEVLRRVDLRLSKAGGAGAVRELVEWLLDLRGDWPPTGTAGVTG